MNWNPDYKKIFKARQERFMQMVSNPVMVKGALEYYKDKPIEFIEDWGITYDPRNAGSETPTLMPFVLFDIQKDLIEFIQHLSKEQEGGLIEKSRDMGATWVAVAYSVWAWLFVDGFSIGWGSRKQDLVDRKGDPDSIFEKIRQFIDKLPKFFLPEDYNPNIHSTFMKLINPNNGSTITGEAGDNIGRGGRKSIYFKDESAHYERPASIEAALGDNTNVQIDFSSVKGTGTPFHNRRQSGVIWKKGKSIPKGIVRVFILDWHDHPNKTQEWYDNRKEKAEREGLSHIFAQEVDRDYNASVEGILIPAKYVQAAIDAHIKLKFKPTGVKVGAQDVADEGLDRNSFAYRYGPILMYQESWGQGDTGVTARKAMGLCQRFGIKLFNYDSIGVGAGVKAETNRLKETNSFIKKIEINPWSASAGVLLPKQRYIPGDKDTPKNEDFYHNLKAQAGWQLRLRFEKTYKMVNNIDAYPIDELISISSELPDLHQLTNELSQPTYSHNTASGKLMIDKKPEGTKSPNDFDSTAIAFFPIIKRKEMKLGAPGGVKNKNNFNPNKLAA